jgi:hypothetical protein
MILAEEVKWRTGRREKERRTDCRTLSHSWKLCGFGVCWGFVVRWVTD